MSLYWVQTDTPFTVAAGSFSPYAEQTHVECLESAGYAVATSGSFTIGNGIATAVERPGGSAQYCEGAVLKLGAVDASLWVDGVVNVHARSGEGRKLSADLLASRLDKTVLSPGTTATLDARIVSESGTLEILKRLFTGTITGVGDDRNESGRCVAHIECDDALGNPKGLYAEDYSVTLRCSTGQAGGVLFNYGDRFDLTTTGSTQYVTIGSGAGFLDASGTGQWTEGNETHGSMSTGYRYFYYQGWENQANFMPGGHGSWGGVRRVDLDAITLDLFDTAWFPNLTMDDPNELGLKSIYINRYGRIDASDGAAPVDGVALWNFQLDFVAQPLIDDIFQSQRSYVVEEEDKTTSGIARLVLEDVGVPSYASFRYPTTNDDAVYGDVVWPGGPLAEFLAQWGQRSDWRFRIDPVENIPEYVYSHTPLTGLQKFTYTLNHMNILSQRSADAGAVASATVMGKLMLNYGQRLRIEEEEATITAEIREPDTPGGTSLAGDYTRWGDTERERLRPIQKTLEQRGHIGETLIWEQIQRYVRKNPLNVLATTTGLPTNSSEIGIVHQEDRHRLMLDEVSLRERIFRGRLHCGDSMVEKRMINPVSFYDNGWPPPAGTRPYALNRNEIGGLGNEKPLYGFKHPQEQLAIVRIENNRLRTRSDAKIVRADNEVFERQNIHKNETEVLTAHPLNGGGINARPLHRAGYHLEEEEVLKTSESVTEYEQITPKDLRTRSTTKSFEKRPSGTAHGSAVRSGLPTPGMGHMQGVNCVGGTSSTSTKRGRLQYAEVLEDDREIIPVGHTVFSAVVAAATGAVRNDRRTHAFAESVEQCERIASRVFGIANSDEWALHVGWNPMLDPDDPILIHLTTEGGVLYNPLAVTDLVAHQISCEPKTESTTQITVPVDYNRIKDSLALRT